MYSYMSYFVPLWFLHFLCLSLSGEDETGSQGRHSTFSDGLLRIPYCVKDVVKERLDLLEEEGGCTHSQLPQHQNLEEIANESNAGMHCSTFFILPKYT